MMTYEEALNTKMKIEGVTAKKIRLKKLLSLLKNVVYMGNGVWFAKCPCCDKDKLEIIIPGGVIDK